MEINVTTIQKFIRQRGVLGEQLSSTGYLLFCLAKAIKEENKIFNAMRKGYQKVVVFDDVDISILIEMKRNWKKVPLLYH